MEDRPSLLVLRSHIAYPSPTKTDDYETHGYALKDDDIRATKEVLGLPPRRDRSTCPTTSSSCYRAAGRRGAQEREAWAKRLDAFDGDRAAFDGLPGRRGPPRLGGRPAVVGDPGESVATRKASGACLQALADVVPALVGRRRRPHQQHRAPC